MIQPDDFSIEGGRAFLNWRGKICQFWSIKVDARGPFVPAVEMDLRQARVAAALVNELDRIAREMPLDAAELDCLQQQKGCAK
jgi:hypothetical protein